MHSLTGISEGIRPFYLRGNITIFIHKVNYFVPSKYLGRTGRRQSLTAEDRFRQQVNPNEICGGGSDIRIDFPLSTLFSHVRVIPLALGNYFNPKSALITRTNVQRVGTSEENHDVSGTGQ
jgi:hypothetical protein